MNFMVVNFMAREETSYISCLPSFLAQYQASSSNAKDLADLSIRLRASPVRTVGPAGPGCIAEDPR